MNTTAKVLVVVPCLVILGSLADVVVRRDTEPRRQAPVPLKEVVQRYGVYAPGNDPNDMGPWPSTWLWQERLARAPDYASLVESALPEARAGNADAQFALYGAFSSCGDGRGAEAHCLALAAHYPDLDAEAENWLAKAIESKFPRALVLASLHDMQSLMSKPREPGERDRRIQAARGKLLLALRSNDPAITEAVAEVLPVLFPPAPQVPRAQWVWRLAACEQGLYCGPKADFVLRDCREHDRCIEGETAPDYIRRASGDFPSLIARARELARMLRKSQLDEKAFDESVTSVPAPRPGTPANANPARILAR